MRSRFGAVPSGLCHHSHKTLGSRLLSPRSYAHGSVTGVLAAVFCRGLGPGTWIVALHFRPVATRASDVFRRAAQAWGDASTAPRSQTDEDLAALRVAAIPHANFHGVDGRRCSAPRERKSGEQFPQGFGVYLPSIQSGVKAAPSAMMRRLEAQVNGRRNGSVRT